jgi:hypothetical protein
MHNLGVNTPFFFYNSYVYMYMRARLCRISIYVGISDNKILIFWRFGELEDIHLQPKKGILRRG